MCARSAYTAVDLDLCRVSITKERESNSLAKSVCCFMLIPVEHARAERLRDLGTPGLLKELRIDAP